MTHPELRAALSRMNMAVDPSEAHGWLAGALCARAGYGAREWLAELGADATTEAGETDPELRVLADETLAAFRSEELAFAPLLPDEDEPLGARLAALASWCDGFVGGIGPAITRPVVERAPDVGEFLGDLADIAHAELEPGGGSDEDEADFTQVFEYVRAGAQLCFEELAEGRADAQA
jgi:uncharacterized protein YgfB (UPF0149 family)